jgi:hypothetical protein
MVRSFLQWFTDLGSSEVKGALPVGITAPYVLSIGSQNRRQVCQRLFWNPIELGHDCKLQG